MIRLDVDQLQLALRQGIRDSFAEAKRQLGEHIYGYSLAFHAFACSVAAIVQSDEGLDRYTEEEMLRGHWKAREGNLRELLRKMHRWPGSDGWIYLESPCFDKANELLDKSYNSDPDEYLDGGTSRLVYATYLACLAELDVDGVFGSGSRREALVLNLYIGDQSDEDTFSWARQVNSCDVWNRYVSEYREGQTAGAKLEYVGPY